MFVVFGEKLIRLLNASLKKKTQKITYFMQFSYMYTLQGEQFN